MFKQIKQMKAMLEGAPSMVEQAQQVAQAQKLFLAQQAVRQSRQLDGSKVGGLRVGYPAPGYAYADRNFEPIAGVSLEQYAAIVKCAAAFGHDASKMAEVAAARGISSVAWQMAVTGWNARLRGDAAVARRFNLRYRES